MENKPKTIQELVNEILAEAKKLEGICQEMSEDSDRIFSAMSGFPVQIFGAPKFNTPNAPKAEPTVQELTISEMTGLSVKVKEVKE